MAVLIALDFADDGGKFGGGSLALQVGLDLGGGGLRGGGGGLGGVSGGLGLETKDEAGGAEGESDDAHDERELRFGRGGGDAVVFHVVRSFSGWNSWRLAV